MIVERIEKGKPTEKREGGRGHSLQKSQVKNKLITKKRNARIPKGCA